MSRSSNQIALEPPAGKIGYLLQGAGFLEQVCCAGDDFQVFFTAKQGKCLLVKIKDLWISATDDKQSRGLHGSKRFTGQIRSAPARNDGGNPRRSLRRR